MAARRRVALGLMMAVGLLALQANNQLTVLEQRTPGLTARPGKPAWSALATRAGSGEAALGGALHGEDALPKQQQIMLPDVGGAESIPAATLSEAAAGTIATRAEARWKVNCIAEPTGNDWVPQAVHRLHEPVMVFQYGKVWLTRNPQTCFCSAWIQR